MSVTQYNELTAVASAASQRAYARYSGFQVAAASISAERSAVVTAIARGSKNFRAIAIATAGRKPAMHCGAGRQALAEFNPKTKISAAAIDGKVQEFELAELLPLPSQGILEGARDV